MLHIFILNALSVKPWQSDELREKIDKLNEQNFLVFNSEYAGHEEILAKQIYDLFPEERIRFYVCGGTGTFRNVINNFMESNRIEFAEIPFGNTNDFLNVFEGEKDKFMDFDRMINGRVIDCDYICSDVGIAHNTISVGFDTIPERILSGFPGLSVLGIRIVYLILGFFSVMFKSSFKANVVIDGVTYNGTFEEIIISKGNTFGAVLNLPGEVNLNDGMLTVNILRRKNFLSKLKGMLALLKKNNDKVLKYWQTIKAKDVSIITEKMLHFNFDGEIQICNHLNSVRTGTKPLKYVVPYDIGGVQ